MLHAREIALLRDPKCERITSRCQVLVQRRQYAEQLTERRTLQVRDAALYRWIAVAPRAVLDVASHLQEHQVAEDLFERGEQHVAAITVADCSIDFKISSTRSDEDTAVAPMRAA